MAPVTTQPPPDPLPSRVVLGNVVAAHRLAARRSVASFARAAGVAEPSLRAVEQAPRVVQQPILDKVFRAVDAHWAEVAPRLEALVDPDSPIYSAFVADPEGRIDEAMGWAAGTYKDVVAELAKGRAAHLEDVLQDHLVARVGEDTVRLEAEDELFRDYIAYIRDNPAVVQLISVIKEKDGRPRPYADQLKAIARALEAVADVVGDDTPDGPVGPPDSGT